MLDAQARKQLLALARRRIRPGSGSDQGFLRSRTTMYPVFNLRPLVQNTPFVVVGAVATRLYMPERLTSDLDVLVLAADASAMRQELKQAGCRQISMLGIGGATWQLPDGSLLDVIESDEPWAREAIAQPVQGPTGLPTIALPYLVLMKLQAIRVQALADITRMLGAADEPALQQVRAVITTYMHDALEDVESMIMLGRLEYE
jgi:hypothetical protein